MKEDVGRLSAPYFMSTYQLPTELRPLIQIDVCKLMSSDIFFGKTLLPIY